MGAGLSGSVGGDSLELSDDSVEEEEEQFREALEQRMRSVTPARHTGRSDPPGVVAGGVGAGEEEEEEEEEWEEEGGELYGGDSAELEAVRAYGGGGV